MASTSKYLGIAWMTILALGALDRACCGENPASTFTWAVPTKSDRKSIFLPAPWSVSTTVPLRFRVRGRQMLKRSVGTASAEMLSSPSADGMEQDMFRKAGETKVHELGFSFSVSGLLYPYHLGAAELLREEGLLENGTPLAGASGGAIAAIVTACEVDTDIVMRATESARRQLVKSALPPVGQLRSVLVEALEHVLPENAHELVNEWEGGVRIGVLRVGPSVGPEHVSHFSSREDLIEVLLGSCHAPLVLDWSLVTPFRGGLAVDGLFANPLTLGCPPTAAQTTACISPFREGQAFVPRDVWSPGESDTEPAANDNDSDSEDSVGYNGGGRGYNGGVISPALLPHEERGQFFDIASKMFSAPAEASFLLELRGHGRRDAEEWLRVREMQLRGEL